jgi:5-methylcytosine-specific restriction endonuclease McrA
MTKKNTYIWLNTSILDDYNISQLSDAEYRAYIESMMNDPKNIHCEVEEPRREWNAIRAEVSPSVFSRDGYKCVYCGSTKNLTVDHIIPLARGGSSEPNNLQTLCRNCNSRKWAKI